MTEHNKKMIKLAFAAQAKGNTWTWYTASKAKVVWNVLNTGAELEW